MNTYTLLKTNALSNVNVNDKDAKVLRLNSDTRRKIMMLHTDLYRSVTPLQEEVMPKKVERRVAGLESDVTTNVNTDVVVKAPELADLERRRAMPNLAYEQHEVKQEVESSRPEPVSRVDDMGRSIDQKWEDAIRKAQKNPDSYFAAVIEKISQVIDGLNSDLTVVEDHKSMLEKQSVEAKTRYEAELEKLQLARQRVVDEYTKEVNRLGSEMKDVNRNISDIKSNLAAVKRDTVGKGGLGEQAERADGLKNEADNTVGAIEASLQKIDTTVETSSNRPVRVTSRASRGDTRADHIRQLYSEAEDISSRRAA